MRGVGSLRDAAWGDGVVVGMSDPLAGLDEVPWAELQHAYGTAIDTPALLRRVAEGTADREVWRELVASLVHQDTVYEASAAAAPFLIALTHTVGDDDLVGVICILEGVAGGMASDSATSERCVHAAERGFTRYVELLAHPQPWVRVYAAKLVASFPERAREASEQFDAALHAERDPAVRAKLLASYSTFADGEDEGVRERLRALADDPDRGVAASAAFMRLKSSKHTADPAWFAAVVRELARPARITCAIDWHPVVRDTPAGQRSALFEAIVRGANEADNRSHAFHLGHAVLWIAFHRRLGGPARKPRPFVFVESLAFPMPWDMGGGAPSTTTERRFPHQVHWRKPGERSPDVEWVCSPFLHIWDRPRPDYWTEPPRFNSLPGINIAEPVTSASLTEDERRVVAMLVRWDTFWRVDSDLPMVYGLPARRDELAALLSGCSR